LFTELCCRWTRTVLVCAGLSLLCACGTNLPRSEEEGRHLNRAGTDTQADPAIPSIVSPVPLVAQPQPVDEPELYTVVAQDVPLRDLLFTMARDAAINVDVHPDVSGLISINAIDQSLPQILERIARQSDIRWSFDAAGNLVVEPDSAVWRTYRVDYVNVARNAQTEAAVSTSITSGGGGGANTSTSSLSQSTANNFWPTLTANLANLLGEAAPVAGGSEMSSIVVNPEAGVVSVQASNRQHAGIAAFIGSVQTRALYQVLIEATVVEVSLNDQYQSGVDWETLGRNSGAISFTQNLLGANLNANTPPTNVLTIDRSASPDAITATIAMLSQFGELRVLSSPKIMALNNQAAMLRVVDNTVYFTIDVQPGVPPSGVSPGTAPVYTTNVQTVPVGFVMAITPQIGENDQVTLNVRPTISRIVRYVQDPSPILAETGVINRIPEIQVREIESILKVFSGQVAILGGLMQDSLSTDTAGLPGLSRLPGVRNLFSYRDDRAIKTELIVFIRPVVIRQASLDGDLQDYRRYLPANNELESSSTTALPDLLRNLRNE
jgi:general secretion pathway protein D